MKKFKLFLILMVATFMSVPKVDAIVNMNGSIFTQAPQLEFFDNTRGTLTSVGAGYNSTYGYWLSNNSLITTGANTDGVNVTFTANEGFVAGYTYSLSILIGTESSRAKPSSTRICTAENIYNANTRFQQGYPCTNAISITSMDGLANFDFGDVSMPYTILTYVFNPDFTSPTITLTYNTVSGNNSRHLFGGYHLEVLSDNKNGISSNEVQSIINNSGLASADSIQELQTEIENVKEDINDAGDAIVESNKETQDVIKDQFNDCHISSNLLNLKDGTYSLNGITAVVNNGIITLNGTASDTTFLSIPLNSEYNVPNGESFTISANNPIATGDAKIRINVTGYYDTSLNIANKVATYVKNSDYDIINNRFQLRIQSGAILENFIIKPQLQLGSFATEWEPYGEEICSNRIDETNDKIDETNNQLNDLNQNITSESENFEDSTCGIICKLGKIPGKIINGLIDGLKSLFIPEDGYFQDWFDNFKTFFEEKLGFLATPFTIFIDFVSMYLDLNPNEDIIINIPDITVPNFEEHKIISATTFNWSQLLKSKESLNALWQLYLSFVDVYLILNFIGLCETKYNRIFGGDTSNYEYYTVEDSISYDGQTGEVTSRRQNERRTTRKKV